MKHTLYTAFACAAFLVACGDDDSFTPKISELPGEVADMDELKEFECSDDIIGEKIYVKDQKADYECDGDHWFEAIDTGKSSSSSEKTSSSSSKKPSSSSVTPSKKSSSSSVTPKSSSSETSVSSSAKSSSSAKTSSSAASSSSQVFTPDWEAGTDGEIRKVDSTGAAFKYDEELDQWVKAQYSDTALSLQGCTTKREGEMLKSPTRDKYYICQESNWHLASRLVIDTYGKKCTEAEVGTFIAGAEIDTNTYYCSVKGWVALTREWNWTAPKDARQNPDIDYGTMTDERDGQTYKTVKIGDQVWMAENLNYADSVKTPSLNGRSWCYGNDSTRCLVTGRLYTWAAAIDSVALANDPDDPMDCGYEKNCPGLSMKNVMGESIQGICPDGWHLPSDKEFEVLFEAVGGQSTAGNALKTTSGWYNNYYEGKGTDDFGFSSLPAGGKGDERFEDAGIMTCYWSSVWYGSDDRRASCMYLEYYEKDADLVNPYKNVGSSVRCIKD